MSPQTHPPLHLLPHPSTHIIFYSYLLFQIIVVSSIMHYEPLTYQGGSSLYVYPEYANILGWFIACASMSIIPLYAIFYILRSKGTAKQVFYDPFITDLSRLVVALFSMWFHTEQKYYLMLSVKCILI